MDKFVSSIPPNLWEIVNDLTLSKRVKLTEAHAHERKVQNAYLVCVVMLHAYFESIWRHCVQEKNVKYGGVLVSAVGLTM